MKVTPRSRMRLRLERVLFWPAFATIIALLAGLSTRYSVRVDWTASGRNSLSAASEALLDEIPGPVTVTAFARDEKLLRRRVADLVARYRARKPDVTLVFVNPDEDPGRARKLGIVGSGALLIEYQGRSELVRRLSEQAISIALIRVARTAPRRIAAIVGHGERRLLGRANHDLGEWGKRLEQRGFTLHELDLAAAGDIPRNTSVLLLAGPRVDLLPGEATLIERFVAGGGNLLWLVDPGPRYGLDALAAALDLRFEEGTIVDPAARRLGLEDPRIVLITQYPPHPVTRGLDLPSLFPQATGIRTGDEAGWRARPILVTGSRAWSETDAAPPSGRFDRGRDTAGPLTIGVALERTLDGLASGGREPPARTQRVVVVGDGDFLSNAYLGNGGNLDLGVRIANWLVQDDNLINVPVRTAPDLTLDLSPAAAAWIGLGTLFGLPLALFSAGIAIWWRRRRL